MKRDNYYNYIDEQLHILAHRITTNGKLNMLRLHLHSENFYLHFFNLIYGYNLINLNDISQNVEAIDLIDHDKKIMIQVSSTSTKQKIESALSKDTLKEYAGYRFKFISIAKDATDLRDKTYKNPHSILFDPKKDIYDIRSFLNSISSLDIDKMKDVYEFIEKELGEGSQNRFDSNVLKEKYLKSFNTISLLTTNTPKPIDEIFVNLAIIKEQKEEKNNDKTINREALLSSYEEIHIEVKELVSKLNKSLIYGKAGIGKTTLCKYIAYKWAKEELYQDFEYVIYIPLREWKKDGIKGAILDHYYSQDIKELNIDFDAHKILFLFDGYDELDTDKQKELQEEIRSNLKNYLITSRRSGYKKDDFSNDTNFYEIEGFNNDGMNLFIDNSFSNQDKQEKIKEFFVKNNNIKKVCKVPFILEMVCSLWQRNIDIEKSLTVTDIYTKVIDNILQTHKQEEVYFRENRRRIKEYLGELAFNGLIGKNITFNGDLLEKLFNYNQMAFFRKSVIPSGFINSIGNNRDILDNELEFYHLTFQEYFSAYYINNKKIEASKIKEKFFQDKFHSKFEEMIIHLTNINSKYIDEFIDIDPFIFRQHPLLEEKQQEKLLLSVIDKLQNNEYLIWGRENLFYNTTLVKFDKLDSIYSLIKDKNIEESQSDILLQYIMRLFAENYSQEFENYIFEIFSQNLHDKITCSKLIGYSYNINYRYNLTLFNFMKKNQLSFIEDNNSINNAVIGGDRNINSYIVEKLFFVLYGFKFQHNNYNQIIGRDDKDYDVEKVVDLVPFIKYESFVEMTSSLISIDDMGVWFKSILKTYKYEKSANYHNNIGWILYKILNYFVLSKETLVEIISFVQKNNISIKPPHFQKYTQLATSLLFYPIQNDFWELYFSDEVQNFGDVQRFLGFYHIQKNDIEQIVQKYPIEENFIKIFELIEWLERQKISIKSLFFSLTTIQRKKLIEYFYSINNIQEDKILIENIIKLLNYDYSKELESFIFELFKFFVNDKKECRDYINIYVNSYDIRKNNSSVKLFYFMKRNNLFRIKDISISNELEQNLFSIYSNQNNCKKIAFLLKYIPYHFFYDNFIFTQKTEKLFIYISKTYNFEIININNSYEQNYGLIIYSLLRYINELKILSFKEIFFLSKNKEILFHDYWDTRSATYRNLTLKEKFGNLDFNFIKNEFWSIYFSDKIKSFEEIKNFISLYDINKKNLEEAIEKYPIEDNIEKYYGLGVQYNFIDVLMDNEKYKEYIENKKEEKEFLDDDEKRYLHKVIRLEKDKQYNIDIQNVNESNFYNVFKYALSKNNNNFKETDKKLRENLEDNYPKFIKIVIKIYNSLDKYDKNCKDENRWNIYNYLFNILLTKEDIHNTLKREENYEKLFCYLINGCIEINDNILKVIEDKFDLFLEVVEEFIENISKKENTTCFDASMKWEWNMAYSPCRQILDIFYKIEFNKEQKIWFDFLKTVEKQKTFQYKNFFELIKDINKEPVTIDNSLLVIEKNNEESFAHFTFVFREDINLALKYFYKYIYDFIPYEIVENNTKLDDFYLTALNDDLLNEDSVFYTFSQDINLTDEEKKLEDKEFLKGKVKIFYKDKNDSYNVVKIILFEKLMKLFEFNEYYKSLDEIHIKRILIDYYKVFNEQKIPLAKDYIDFNGQLFPTQGESSSVRLILNLWGLLQNDKKYKRLLKELKKSNNKNISNSAGHCLNKINTKEISNKEINFENILEEYSDSNKPLIITEGKTDWKHLKKALEKFKQDGEYQNLDVQFLEYDENDVLMSDSELAVHVRTYSNTSQSKKHIMIFDRDATEKKDINKIFNPNKHFTYYGNKVYSLFIPPIGRLDKICIEFYYKQEEVQEAWFAGKRLFYGNEFDSKTQKSICGKYKTDKPYPQDLDILDGDNKKKVYKINDDKKKENNIALSKNKFSENILKGIDGFDNFDIENFRLIFDEIEKIVND